MRITLTVAAVVVLYSLVDLRQLAQELARLDPVPLLTASFYFAIQILIVTVRSSFTLRAAGLSVPLPALFRANATGQAAGVATVPGVGQVIGRALLLVSEGVPVRAAIVNTGFEKALALLGMTVAGFGSLGLLWSDGLLQRAAIVASVVAIGLLVTEAGLRLQAILTNKARPPDLQGLGATPLIFMISLASHACLVLAYVSCAEAHGIYLDSLEAVAAFSVVILATTLPISIGGWGVREVAMVFLLDRLGISATAAAATGVTIGLVGTVVLGLLMLVGMQFIALRAKA